jgi:glucose/arabinose dehydrogenase
VARAIAPDYVLGPHTVSLGLAWSASARFPAAFSPGMFVGQHGSFGRDSSRGHKVVFVPFAGGRPTGPPVDLLTGFLAEDGTARGRPISVALDAQGALLVADDIGDVVWRVTTGR